MVVYFLHFLKKKKKIRVNIVTIYEKKLRLISVVTKQKNNFVVVEKIK